MEPCLLCALSGQEVEAHVEKAVRLVGHNVADDLGPVLNGEQRLAHLLQWTMVKFDRIKGCIKFLISKQMGKFFKWGGKKGRKRGESKTKRRKGGETGE